MGIATAFVMLAAALTVAFVFYGDHALPGTRVAGQPVGGQSRDQLTQTVHDIANQQKIIIVTPDGASTPVNFSDAGLSVDADKTVEDVFAQSGGIHDRLGNIFGAFGTDEYQPVLSPDMSKLEKYATGVQFHDEQSAVSAEVKYDQGAQKFVATEGTPGVLLNADALSKDLLAARETFQDATVQATSTVSDPAYSTEVAQAAADKANQWLDQTIQTTDDDYNQAVADRPTMSGWVKFKTGEGNIVPEINADAITAWVDSIAAATNREPEGGVQNVNSAGKVLATVDWGTEGRKVSNTADIVNGIAEALKNGTSYEGDFTYATVDPTFEQRPVAEGAGNLVYAAAPGERWIDVDLSTDYLTAYEGASAVMQIPFVPGAAATPTLTGQWNVYAKIANHTMRGENADGTKYETPDVPATLYYDGGYALHGAYWRSYFGYYSATGGSHGCVNLPVSSAWDLYDWASVGTVVNIHY